MSTLFEATADFVTIGPAFDTRKRYLRAQATPSAYAIPAGPTMVASVQYGLKSVHGYTQPPSINWSYKCGGWAMSKRLSGSATVTPPTVTNTVVNVDT